MDVCSTLLRCLGLTGSSWSPACESFDRSNILRINDHVFQIGTRPERPSVEVVFFHGLQLEDQEEPHITTWLSRDKTEVWLNWLIAEFPDIRILVIRYDASVVKTRDKGRMEMYVVGENILEDLTRLAGVGDAGCPIILVGHCLGGLVLKEVCVQAGNRAVAMEGKAFFDNVQAVLFYASPHNGSELPVWSVRYPKGNLFAHIAPLYAERDRRNEAFRKLQNERKWITAGFGELRPVTLKNFRGLVVPQASSRHGIDTYYTVDADHFNVCRPESNKNPNYSILAALVDKIIRKDETWVPASSDILDNVVGLERRVEIIRSKLVAESRIAIVGMPGIGKTTLAQAVHERIGKDFQYLCFYEEVKNSIGKKESPQGLRDKVGKQFVDARGRRVDETFQWSDLRGKRVLVVLDDVISENQIKVMMTNDQFHKRSRVIITARNREFIQKAKLGFDIFEMEKLDRDSSRELFCLCAFGKREAPPDFYSNVEEIANKCDGHPLALTISGKYLHSERKSLWEDAFTRLREAKSLDGENEDGLWSLLSVSVDSLADYEKEMFLDVATCFHRERLNEVKIMWTVCKLAPETGWKNLLDRHLVKGQQDYVSSGDTRTYVHMHEVLRDLGRKMAGRSRMLVSDLHLVSNQEVADVKVVKGEMDELDQSRESLLCKLTKTKVLWLTIHRNMDIGNHGHRMELNWSALKEVLFAKVLGANNSTLRKIHGFQCLKFLDISFCHELMAVPTEICGLQNLESFDISHCSNLVVIPAEIGGLCNLQSFNISHCTSLIVIPAEIGGLQILQKLNLSHCENLMVIPAQIGALRSLKDLDMSSCKELIAIPTEIGRLQNLQCLKMFQCTNLETIPTEIGGLQNLQDLDMSSCHKLREIPMEICRLHSLRNLRISGCHQLEIIPTEIDGLQSLQDLDMSFCWKLRAIPIEIGRLHSLQDLKAIGCDELEAIPAEIGGLQSLRNLEIHSCLKLTTIPAEIGKLQSLENLDVSCCPKLMSIPPEIGGLRRLQKLNMSECSRLRAIPAEIGGLQSLQELDLAFCSRLIAIPAQIGELHCLLNFDIDSCEKLIALPAEVRELQSLRVLQMPRCENLVTIPGGIGELQGLQILDISYCSELEAIPAEIGRLQSLQQLDLSFCSKLVALPTEIGGLQSLQKLNICRCSELETIPAEIGSLKSLQDLYMPCCKKLIAIPAEIGRLRGLKNLDISYCSKLERIPTEIGRLQNLRVLNMTYCENLVMIPAEVGGLQSLQEWDLSFCQKIIEIPVEISLLHSLQIFNISFCPELRSIPAEMGRLLSLEKLFIVGNPELVIPTEVCQRKGLHIQRVDPF